MSSYFGLIRKLKDSRNYVGELARQYSLDKALRDQVENTRYRSFSRSESPRLILRELPGVMQNGVEVTNAQVPEEPDNVPDAPVATGLVTMMFNFDHELEDRSGMNNDAVFEFTSDQLLFADGMGSTQLLPAQITAEGFGLPSSKGKPVFAADPDASDIFGIRKIYDTKVGGDEWYMDNANVIESDKNRLYKPDTLIQGVNGFSTVAEDDYAFIIHKSGYNRNGIDANHHNANIKGFLQQADQWKNVEITGYFTPTSQSTTNSEIRMSVRHGSKIEETIHPEYGFPDLARAHGCEYSGYIGGIRNMNNAVPFFHKRFSSDENIDATAVYKQGTTQGALMNNRFGIKFIVYTDNNNNVKLELWMDKNNNNTWIKIHERVDSTGWNFLAGIYTSCADTPDHKILFGGPLIEISWSDVQFDSSDWSVREIEIIGAAPTPISTITSQPTAAAFGYAVDFNPLSKSTYDKLWVPFSDSTQLIYNTPVGFSTVQRWLLYDISDTYPRATSKLKDYNGAVFNKVSPTIHLIFWGDSWNLEPYATRKSELIAKTKTLLNSTYFDALWQYRDIKKPVYGTDVVSTFPIVDQEALHTDNIKDCVINAFETGLVPHPMTTTLGEEWFDFHHYYFVYLPVGKDIGGGFWGAHSASQINVAVPDQNKFFAWGTQQYYSGQFDSQGYAQYTPTDVMMQIFSHELVNSLAYPYPGEVEGFSGFGDPVALGGGPAYSPCGNQMLRKVNDVLVQSYWSDVDGKCVCPGSGESYTPKPTVTNSSTGSYRYRYLWHKQDDLLNGSVCAISPDGTLYFNILKNGTQYKVKTPVHTMWKTYRWYEIFWSFDTATNKPTIWVNNIKYETASTETLLFNNTHSHFIFGNWNMGQTLGQIRGRLDDMKLYRSGLVTDSGVSNYYLNGLSITPVGIDPGTSVFVVNRTRLDSKLDNDTFVCNDVIVEDTGRSFERNGISVMTSGGGADTTANTTQYFYLGVSGLSLYSTEVDAQVPHQLSGVITKLYVRVSANTIPGPSTITVRRNGIDTDLVAIIPNNTNGGFEDITDHVVIQAGDKMSYKFTPGHATGTMRIHVASVIFTPDLYTSSRIIDQQATTFNHASGSRYTNIGGRLDAATTTENQAQTRIAKSSKAWKMFLNIASNARTTTTTFRLRKNAADTTLFIDVPAGQIGFFENTTDQIGLLPDDKVNFAVTTGAGTENLSLNSMGLDIQNVNNDIILLTARTGDGSGINRQSANTTFYYQIGGALNQDTTEDFKKQKLRQTMRLSQLSVNIQSNTVSATSTLRLRKNGANANQFVTIPSNTSGFFTDAVNVDDITPYDELDYQLITGATGTSLTIRSISINTLHKPETGLEIPKQIIPEPIPDT